MAVFSVVFERQGEGSRQVNGLAHVRPRSLTRNSTGSMQQRAMRWNT
jgi:hypothetical protein